MRDEFDESEELLDCGPLDASEELRDEWSLERESLDEPEESPDEWWLERESLERESLE